MKTKEKVLLICSGSILALLIARHIYWRVFRLKRLCWHLAQLLKREQRLRLAASSASAAEESA